MYSLAKVSLLALRDNFREVAANDIFRGLGEGHPPLSGGKVNLEAIYLRDVMKAMPRCKLTPKTRV